MMSTDPSFPGPVAGPSRARRPERPGRNRPRGASPPALLGIGFIGRITGIVRIALIALLASSASTSGARADVLVLRGGGEIEGTIVEETDAFVRFKTRFGTQKIERGRIVEIRPGRTPEQEFAERRADLGADDVEGLASLARWAGERGLRKEARSCWERIVELSPSHETANRALGRVLHDGEWMSPGERDRREREAYVRKGWVRYKGEWMPRADAERLIAEAAGSSDGGGGETGPRADAPGDAGDGDGRPEILDIEVFPDGDLATTAAAEIVDAIGVRPVTITTEHFVFVSLLDEAKTLELARKAETTIRWIFRFLEGHDRIRPWSGKARYYLFDGVSSYEDFVTYVVPKHITDERFLAFLRDRQRQGRTIGISARTDGIPFAADYDQTDTPWDNLIHAKVGTFCLENYCGRVPAWLRTGFAAWIEWQFTGSSRVRSITNTSYGGRADLADKASDSKFWEELLVDAVRHEEDPRFDELRRKPLNQLDYLDLSKSWSVVTFLCGTRKDDFVAYCRGLRKGDPGDAFTDAMKQSHDAVDAEWRAWLAD